MKSRSFDVAVLGTSLAGLVAAVTLQRKGVKVILLQSKEEISFDPAISEFLSGFTIRPFLKRAGFHPTEVNAIPALDVPIQIVDSQFRINFYGEEDRFQSELQREFPLHEEHVLQMFKTMAGKIELFQHLFNSRVHLAPKGFFAKRQFYKSLENVCDAASLKFKNTHDALETYHLDRSFSPIMEAIQLSATNLVSQKMTTVRFSHLLTLLRWEGFRTEEGLLTMKKSLMDKMKEYGGTHFVYESMEEFTCDGDKPQNIRFKGADWDEVQFQSLIIAGNPRSLTGWIEKKRTAQRWKNYVNDLPVLAVKAYQVYKLKSEGVPVGMKEQGLILPKHSEGQERRTLIRALRYTIRPNKDKTETTVVVTAFLKTGARIPTPEEVSDQIKRRLYDIIPFMDEFLIDAPSLPIIPNIEHQKASFRDGFVYESDHDLVFGVQGLDPETPLHKTYLANEMIMPGLGLDGETITGLHIAELIANDMPRSSI